MDSEMQLECGARIRHGGPVIFHFESRVLAERDDRRPSRPYSVFRSIGFPPPPHVQREERRNRSKGSPQENESENNGQGIAE